MCVSLCLFLLLLPPGNLTGVKSLAHIQKNRDLSMKHGDISLTNDGLLILVDEFLRLIRLGTLEMIILHYSILNCWISYYPTSRTGDGVLHHVLRDLSCVYRKDMEKPRLLEADVGPCGFSTSTLW